MSEYSDTCPFVEAQLILAAQGYQHSKVDRLAATLLPGERRDLADACDRLAAVLRSRL